MKNKDEYDNKLSRILNIQYNSNYTCLLEKDPDVVNQYIACNIISKNWRRYKNRKRFSKIKMATITIQKTFRKYYRILEPKQLTMVDIRRCDFCNSIKYHSTKMLNIDYYRGWQYCNDCTKRVLRNKKKYLKKNRLILWKDIQDELNIKYSDLLNINLNVLRTKSKMPQNNWGFLIKDPIFFSKKKHDWCFLVSTYSQRGKELFKVQSKKVLKTYNKDPLFCKIMKFIEEYKF